MYVGIKRDTVTVVLLSIVTCGIYFYYWMYVTSRDINRAMGQERMDLTLLLILSILCAPVMFYWFYQMDKCLLEIGRQERVQYEEHFILWLLLSLVCGIGSIVAEVQVQDFMNRLWDTRAGHAGGR